MVSIRKPSKSAVDPQHAIAVSELTLTELNSLLQLSDKHSKSDMRERRSQQHVADQLEDLVYNPNNFRPFARMVFGQALWRFLKRPDNLIRMQTATYLKRPA